MKKFQILAVAAAVATVSTSALAGQGVVEGWMFNSADSKETHARGKAGYAFDNGLEMAVETGTNDSSEVNLAYKANITDGFYLKPEVGYVMKHGNKDDAANRDHTARAGLTAGYDFNNGLFVSGRYRYEQGGMNGKISQSARSEIDRYDLKLGYNFEKVSVYGQATNKSQLNSSAMNKGAKDNWTDYEVRATLTSLGNGKIKPYLQYENKDLGHKGGNFAGKTDDVIRVGASYSF